MNDYGKFGVWTDGYYLSVNQFNEGKYWAGAGVAVLERDKMLQGLPARMITFDLYQANPNFGGLLPADLDGQRAPPAGAPVPFVEWDDAWEESAPDVLRVWNFHVDWNQPNLSTFGTNLQPNRVIPTADVNPHNQSGSLWITQPNTTQKLDALTDRLMYRLQYRNFGAYQTLVCNHTVDADGNYHAGIHWFELRAAGTGAWSLFQEGVLAPDTNNRWMGSLAMDGSGNMALGYSLSGKSRFPSIAYSGRSAGDPVGTMPRGEVILVAGGGSQLHNTGRWGDYSTMSIDPLDDCTFWYTQEVLDSTGLANWRTEIGSFRFPTCGVGSGVLHGAVTSSLDGTPIAGVRIEANGVMNTTDAAGLYQMILQPGAYTVTAALFGYGSESVEMILAAGGKISKNFIMTPFPMQLVAGAVVDGSGHAGMPLFARLDIPAYHASPVYTDPLSGHYQLSLPLGISFYFTVSAEYGGYQSVSRIVTPVIGTNLQNFELSVDSAACSAPGYSASSGTCQLLAGGLVVGTVQDANQPPLPAPQPLSGATVSAGGGGAGTVTGLNPPGGYSLFMPAGSRDLSASYPGYGGRTQPVTVIEDTVVKADFDLPAGYLTLSPVVLPIYVSEAEPRSSFQFTLQNAGSLPVHFNVNEALGLLPDPAPTGPFAPAGRRLSPKRSGERTAASIYEYVPPEAPAWLGGGMVLRSWPAGLAAPWGIAIANGTVWVNDTSTAGGDGLTHAFSKDGQPRPGGIAQVGPQVYFADLSYDPARDRLWQAAVSGEPCVEELDPSAARASGVKICPLFGSSQRGLAYDPVSQTFFSGTWNDAILSHFDRSGRLLDSANLGINISGIAYHPGSQRLYVLSNANEGYDVYVVEARQPYRILGGFDVPGMADFGQAGLDLSPDGHLWVVDAVQKQVLEISTGEAPFSDAPNVPWLVESQNDGTLAAGHSVTVEVTVDANQFIAPRCAPTHQATLTVTTDSPYDKSPYQVPPMPITAYSISIPCLGYAPLILGK